MTTTPAPVTFTVTLQQYDPATRKQRVYGQRCGTFCVLWTRQGITISAKDAPFQPLLFDGKYILCFSSVGTAKQFIAFLIAQKRPTFFNLIAHAWSWKLHSIHRDAIEREEHTEF